MKSEICTTRLYLIGALRRTFHSYSEALAKMESLTNVAKEEYCAFFSVVESLRTSVERAEQDLKAHELAHGC